MSAWAKKLALGDQSPTKPQEMPLTQSVFAAGAGEVFSQYFDGRIGRVADESEEGRKEQLTAKLSGLSTRRRCGGVTPPSNFVSEATSPQWHLQHILVFHRGFAVHWEGRRLNRRHRP